MHVAGTIAAGVQHTPPLGPLSPFPVGNPTEAKTTEPNLQCMDGETPPLRRSRALADIVPDVVIACFCGDQSPQMWQIVQDMNTREL